jgi:tyrosine-protein phosphatase SIW14
MSAVLRGALVAAIVGVVVVAPVVVYRCTYTQTKRLRDVTPGRVYRSGQMTADGFADAVARYGIRTVINLQDEYPDPDVRQHSLGGGTIKEQELCRNLGVRYVYMPPDLISRRLTPHQRPKAIDRFLALMDDPASYPVLVHCKAGLHRTGVMVAVYRMEYEGWTPRQALEELRDNGFGEWASSAANDYISQYVLTYRRGLRQPQHLVLDR